MELTVSSHRRNLNSWSLEPGTWKLSLEAGNWSPETEKVPGTIWEIEAGAALQGASKSGPADPLLKYISGAALQGASKSGPANPLLKYINR